KCSGNRRGRPSDGAAIQLRTPGTRGSGGHPQVAGRINAITLPAMKLRPLIGITTDSNDADDHYSLHLTDVEAVEKAGGLALLIPFGVDDGLIPQYVDRVDGILFTGGNDMNPGRYGQEWHPKVSRMNEQRETFEFALLAEVEKRRMPALGVCFG